MMILFNLFWIFQNKNNDISLKSTLLDLYPQENIETTADFGICLQKSAFKKLP